MEKAAVNPLKIKKYTFGLKAKFVLGLIFIVLCVTAAAVLIGAFAYWNSVTNHYNTVAYQTAEVAKGYFTEEEMRNYADIVNRYNHGAANESELRALEADERYQKIWTLVEDLRKGMGANDIYVSVFDIDVLKNFDEEKYKQKQWNPVYYIMDSYYDTEKQFRLGDSGAIVSDYREDMIQAYETGVHMERKIITDWQFGYILTASYPVAYQGDTVAFIAVEIPMKTLKSDIADFVTKVLIVVSIVTALILIAGILFIVHTIIEPIRTVSDEAMRFVDDNTAISNKLDKIQTRDEIQTLSASLLTLEVGVNHYIDNLTRVTAEKERIGAELNVAAQIQADMLPGIFPAFPERKEFDIYATMTPAKEVGGDFYDFFLIDDDHLGLVMADVSGKGVPAALFMVIAKTLIKNRAQMIRGAKYSPAEIFSYVNNQLCEGNEAELFVTVWFAVLQISTGKGIAANAGHEYPVIRRAGGSYELVKDKHSPALAAMEGLRFKEHEFELHAGDSLYVYTDGVPEATNTEEELFGTERMLAALNEDADAAPKKLLETVKRHIDTFVAQAPQFDDITMLCLRYFGEGGKKE